MKPIVIHFFNNNSFFQIETVRLSKLMGRTKLGLHTTPRLAGSGGEPVHVHRLARQQSGDQTLETDGELKVKRIGEVPREFDVKRVQANLGRAARSLQGPPPPPIHHTTTRFSPFNLRFDRGKEIRAFFSLVSWTASKQTS